MSTVTTPALEPTLADHEQGLPIAKFSKEELQRVSHWVGEDVSKDMVERNPVIRHAVQEALSEITANGRGVASPAWRQKYALTLGLERLLAEDTPHLVDGTELSDHQVDALAGTLAALLANGSGTDDEPTEDEVSGSNPSPKAGGRRFWFEHATGAGKSVAALGLVEATRGGGVLILTHRTNLVDQFLGELRSRGYTRQIAAPLLGSHDKVGIVSVETYQWFLRHHKELSEAYTLVICDEAHTALGEKTSAAILGLSERGVVCVGMTATGSLIERSVEELFPVLLHRFDLKQAAKKEVISALRCVRIAPGVGVRTLANVPLRPCGGEQDFDQEQLAELLDQAPFNAALADLYKARFNNIPGIVYTAGVQHAENVAAAMQAVGIRAVALSGKTSKRVVAETLAAFERGDVDILVNAMLLAEGWNSRRATLCMHLAPTASRRIYQQRVGRVTRVAPEKEAGIIIDFVHPATTHAEPIVTLHKLLEKDIYRAGAIVVGNVRIRGKDGASGSRNRGERLIPVERGIVPVNDSDEQREETIRRELWRVSVGELLSADQEKWATIAGERVTTEHWDTVRKMIPPGNEEVRDTFLLSCLVRNPRANLQERALQAIAKRASIECLGRSVAAVCGGSTEVPINSAARILLAGIAERCCDEPAEEISPWLWQIAESTRNAHERYAAQAHPETKRLLGQVVNSSGAQHLKNTRRLVQTANSKSPRIRMALLASAMTHSADAEAVLTKARNAASEDVTVVSRELLQNLSGGRKRRRQRKRSRKPAAAANAQPKTASSTPKPDAVS